MKGRTWRKRQQKFVTKELVKPIDHTEIEENKHLGKWVKKMGTKKHRLQSRIFPETGRGMMALSNFSPGDVIISLPFNLLITADTVLNSTIGHYIKSYNPKLSLHQALALFLLFEKNKGEDSIWWNYLQTIPKSFTTVGYFSQEECVRLPERLQNSVQIHITKLRKDYRHCQKLWFMRGLYLNFEAFQWAWYAVNSRSVYYKTTCDHLEEEECNMALAPFLDLLNHSTEAKSEAKFNTINQCYEITTGNIFRKYDQVFISYGPHDNHKLFLEYGFILPNNPNSVYPITQEMIFELANQEKVKHFSQKIQILKDNNLLKESTCSNEGVDWKLDKVFKILSCNWTQLQNWKQIILGTVLYLEVVQESRRLSLILLNKELDKTLQQIQSQKPPINYHEEICNNLLLEDLKILQTSLKLQV
ncbi:hypothetical protein LOTGIDRAFT_210687 [Lottia gigantea]|uniref:SET domain-containing protein n=1 Tax=Lottia gigantea TaxID=225164 RepID=V3ZXF8_LOTGI|nr:hypothetical protein LOTGIDRAFT_210687 [Lottia gigantea]ESO87310.1 hypothetical protein LOTGIDRAFT_210687 [Lottia gigantea]